MPSVLSGSILQFGGFRLDCGRFQLSRDGHPLRIERKPMELLILLASRDGQVVTRQEIAERLWSSQVFVDTEHGINTAIRKLRYLLRDDPGDPHFIQTVTGMGYRFVAPVSLVPVDSPSQFPSEATPSAASPSSKKRLRGYWYVAAGACLALALGGIGLHFYQPRHRTPEVAYTQLTDFTDSAVAPALSKDGRMLAFIRGGNPFLTTDPIYVKMLPDGEARRVTNDDRPKYGLAFSPDGSEIAYTVLEASGFSTYEVSALGGESHLLLNNAAGLVWLDSNRLLFSEIRSGIHLGVVTSTASRADVLDIYFPPHQRGMVHSAFPSPDHRWALVVEMNDHGGWARCRLVNLLRQTSPRPVGPAGACTSAGWSPDGWMYFTAIVNGESHIWRQRFPQGQPEQITFGPTQQDGIAVEPDGRALITSDGAYESAIWIHNSSGDRPLSSEGEVVDAPSSPVFSSDARLLYYLLRREDSSGAELWRAEIGSGRSEVALPGISIFDFDISPDGRQVVYTSPAPDGGTQLWVAQLDRSSAPIKLNISGARSPHFSAHGRILFQHAEGTSNYLEQIDQDGSHRSKVFPYPIVEFQGVSPGRRWVVAAVPLMPPGNLPEIAVIPLQGGAPRRICDGYCQPKWSPDGKFLFVTVVAPSRAGPGRTLAIPLGPAESFPNLPARGVAPMTEPSVIPEAKSIARGQLVPGQDPEHYAWVNTTIHRNLYRLSLP